jgi:hypothetical protein
VWRMRDIAEHGFEVEYFPDAAQLHDVLGAAS